jgi:hypothetical protein
MSEELRSEAVTILDRRGPVDEILFRHGHFGTAVKLLPSTESSPPLFYNLEGPSTGASEYATAVFDEPRSQPVGEALSWNTVLRAAEKSSFAFLAEEPDIYSLEDGEPV